MIDYFLFKEIELYANRHVESSRELYKNRNQNEERLFINCLRGKVAEWECYFSMLQANYIMKAEPDMKIYSSHNKSYDADLVCIGKDKKYYDSERFIHVKSISQATYKKIGASFLIQTNDNIVKNPLENHYYSVMLQQSLTHYTFFRWLNTCDAVYSKPRNKNLTSKLAVYL